MKLFLVAVSLLLSGCATVGLNEWYAMKVEIEGLRAVAQMHGKVTEKLVEKVIEHDKKLKQFPL